MSHIEYIVPEYLGGTATKKKGFFSLFKNDLEQHRSSSCIISFLGSLPLLRDFLTLCFMKVVRPTKNTQLVSFSEISQEFTQPCDCGSPTHMKDLPKTRWWQGKYALSWPRSVLLCWKKSKPGAGDTGCLQKKLPS